MPQLRNRKTGEVYPATPKEAEKAKTNKVLKGVFDVLPDAEEPPEVKKLREKGSSTPGEQGIKNS